MSVSRAIAEDAPVRGSTAARDGDKGSLCPSRVGFSTQRRPVVNGMPTGMPTRLLSKVRFQDLSKLARSCVKSFALLALLLAF
jgi:hypothetical protein